MRNIHTLFKCLEKSERWSCKPGKQSFYLIFGGLNVYAQKSGLGDLEKDAVDFILISLF